MSRTNWKQVERDAAALFGAKRFWANAGERLDFESHYFLGQVKHVKTLSLAALEALAHEMETEATTRDKVGVVVVKRSGGRGRETPILVTMTASQWANIARLLPEPFQPGP